MLKHIYNFFSKNYYKRYHGQYAHAKKLFVIDIGLFAATFVLFVSTIYFIFWNPGLTDQIDLGISFGDGRVLSGQEVKVVLDYKNRSKYILKDSVLAVHLPEGFVIDRGLTPNNILRDDNTIDLQNLRPGATGQQTIYGRLWVEPKTDYRVTALLSYLPENSGSREQKIGLHILNLPDSILTASIDIATTTFAGTRLPFTYKLKNTSDYRLTNLKFNFDFPGGVTITSSSPSNDLQKDDEKTIFGEVIVPRKTDQFILKISATADINNHPITILNTETKVKNYSPEIGIAAKTADATFVEPKQVLNASLKWQNYGQLELSNESIHIAFTPGTVDLKTTAKENGFETDGKDLIITPKERTALFNGTPSATDEFNFKVFLLPTFTLNNSENAKFQIIPRFVAEIKELPGQIFTVYGANAELPMATELNLSAQARYYSDDGDQLGRGPLPLQADETTKYWIFIRVINTTNAVRDAVMSATLPSGVKFAGQQSVTIGPSIVYNDATGDLNWKFYALPANSQTGLYFEVAVTPSAEQLNKNINLLTDLKFSATDKITGKQFNLTQNIVTNQLPLNDIGSKRGNIF